MSEGAGSVKRGVTGASGGKKAAAKRTAKSTAAKKAATGRTAAGTAAGRTAAKSAATTKTKKTAARKTATAGTAAAKKTAAGKTAAKKASGRADKVGAASAAEQTGATTVVAKKTPGTATAGRSGVPKARLAAADPGELAVRPGEDPWNPEEVAEARAELQREADRLRAELDSSEKSLAGLMRDSGDGAGDDEADTGTKNITREHELALAANAREMLEQTEHALRRLDAGTYGLCENCGNPIGKARMQAFPRATLCVECKQKQERRY
ncbi:TraR/DksA family transcriptional regulator [Streptomyces sp. NPDC086091]|uniref:TraR/DksA family transcriptional regulator n=1 Tax=Streptomyces sp. NPDC086091 TaxID=3365751 RepID=UPI00382208E3